MKKFNLNDHIYIQITEDGWDHLRKTVSETYINACIDNDHYRKVIDGQTWYRIQAYEVFSLFPVGTRVVTYFKLNVLIDEENLKPIDIKERRIVHQYWYESKESMTGWDSHGWAFEDGSFPDPELGWSVVEYTVMDKYGKPCVGIAERTVTI